MRNRRTPLRSFLIGLAPLLVFLVPTVVAGQQTEKVPRIGWGIGAPWGSFPTHQALIAGMRDHGYVEGRDYVMETRNTEGKGDRYADLTAELSRLPVDVLLVPACGAPLKAARQATQTIPIV